MEWIEGGVTAAKGFMAAGMHCGIRPNKAKNDLALICAEAPCTSAGLFTTNKVKADPVMLDMETIRGGHCQAILANSGIANACAPNGRKHAEEMQALAAKALGLSPDKVLVGSTGVIGQELPIGPVRDHIGELKALLTEKPEGSDAAAHAIMTTDTRKKELAVRTTIAGKTVTIGGISKGSGMIHPNMGTMLCYLTTDAAIAPDMLRKALLAVCRVTFNRISVDGDTSTNDSLIILADGLAGNPEITAENEDYFAFVDALKTLCTELARRMARDGEGAKHLITCTVSGARSEEEAETLAKSVIHSTLTKAAIFGCDANWGRVLCALGYSGVDFDPKDVDVAFASKAGQIEVCAGGVGIVFDEDRAKKILSEEEVEILVDMHEGGAAVTCWGCDLTYDYVKINGDYRT